MLVICLTACSFSSALQAEKDTQKVSKSTFLLDTLVTVTLYGTEDEALIDGCFDLCREYEEIFSRTDENSELYKLNHTGEMTVSQPLQELLETALYYCRLSDGAFDITLGAISEMYGFSSDSPRVPSQQELDAALAHVGYENITLDGSAVTLGDRQAVIDLGAIAKGYIADRLAEYLLANGQESAIISLGGNILCVGGKPDGSDFTVGLQYPFQDMTKTIAAVKVSGMSVVTSGIYERSFEQDGVLYHHILDPKTGLPCQNNLLAVSILSESSVDGDALSTVCFLLGLDRGLELINSIDGIYAVFVTDDYALHYSDGFEAYLAG
jgi:thiamine biosynthesis lipoprotein